MYRQHFGLREPPFGITPDTSYFFACPVSQQALNTLLVAVGSGEGFIKITGEVGTGKTLLCRTFMTRLDESFVTAYIPNPYLEPRSLLLALADELDIAVPARAGQHQVLKAINLRLLELAAAGKRVVLCLDEAQAMPLPTLEALRLLTNLETEKRKLLQIVLFGQPELDEKLQQDSIRQLAQRITFHYVLRPFEWEEMGVYVAHRLQVAGHENGKLFDHQALRTLHRTSGGVPRLVNVLAHKCLMLAYGAGSQQVSARQVRMAAADTLAARPAPSRWLWACSLGVLLASGGIGWMVWP